MKQLELSLAYFYPTLMNTYGDYGNVLALIHRARIRGISLKVHHINIADNFDSNSYDLLFMGGGQDVSQSIVAKDLMSKKNEIKKFIFGNKPGLLICGAYQLFGKEFVTLQKEIIPGLELLPIVTIAHAERLIGDVLLTSQRFGQIIGFENHSGKTYFLDKDNHPLGRVMVGGGNNASDGNEGIIYHNVIASYLHGSLLPKNPKITDFLLEQAFILKYPKQIFLKADSKIEDEARLQAIKKIF